MSRIPDWYFTALALFFPLLTIFVLHLNWNRLAKHYRTYESPPANFWRMQHGSVGWLYYKGTLNVGVSRQGIYLSIFPLFSFGLPPLLIPWSAIRKIEPANSWFVQRFRLYLSVPKVKLVINKEVLEPAKEYLAAQGFEWI
ncbi:hypothetical protein NIES2109_11910 [Nostoc sp. HK-01]|uniref:Uncharacterized protein n=2 Tax=Nostocales TaxID=1161 RepID=A0A1Z4GJ32_9CYAN|nr:hypothetical protein [Nostoc cycadae]BAY17482.1 hypothetical protein NIES21_33200 [Anabaenopsis circularis NIES-21]BBD58416.1 hypothetical protein NIES2109_11910 [Nostoc sp. HK-01]